jgi:nitroreductase
MDDRNHCPSSVTEGSSAALEARLLARLPSILTEAIDLATLAPSSHNSQPWALASLTSREAVRPFERWLGDERDGATERWLVLALDRARAIRALDAHALEMRLSCGMFLQLLVGALANRGVAARVVPLVDREPGVPPVAGWPATWAPLAALALRPGLAETPEWSPALVRERRTNRGRYEGTCLERATRARFAASRPLFGDRKDREALRIHLFDDRRTVGAMGDFVSQHSAVDFEHSVAWRETYGYIRFSDRQIAAHADGFPVSQLFGDLSRPARQLLRVALSPPLMRALRRASVPRLLARQLGELVRGTPTLACVSTGGCSPWRELVAGGAMMELWMRATASGLAMHPVSVILQHEDIRRRFESTFGLEQRVVFFARLGQPTASFPPTPRRSLVPDGTTRGGWLTL